MGGVTNTQILRELESLRDSDLAEIKLALKTLNGRVRETEQTQASLVQWRRDHEAVDEETRGEIKALRNKTNIAGVVLAIGQAATSIGAFLFGQKGP